MPISDPSDPGNYEWGIDPTQCYTDAGVTLAVADGDAVQQANDPSGNSRHSTQATLAQKPRYVVVGGKPALRIDDRSGTNPTPGGSVQKLVSTSFLGTPAFNTAFTCYFVCEFLGRTGLRVLAMFGGTNLFIGHETNSLQPRLDCYTNNLTNTGNRYHNYDGVNKVIICVRYNGTNKKIRLVSPDAGVDSETTHANTGNLSLSGAITVGDGSSGGFSWRGFLYGAHLYSAYHDDTTQQDMIDYLTTEHCGEPAPTVGVTGGGTRKLIADGNSLTFGTGATPGSTDYPTQLAALLSGSWTVSNLGIAAQSTGDMLLDAETEVDTLYDAASAQNVVIAWEGTNDLYYGHTPLVSARRMRDYILRRRYKGFQAVFCMACLSRADGGTPGTFNTSRATYNARLVTDATGKRVIRLDLDSRIGDNGDEQDGTYFDPDDVHMDSNGYSVVAALAASQANLSENAAVMLCVC